MKFWLGCAMCLGLGCFGQVAPFRLPPLEQGLAGSGLLSSSEGSSVLPTSSEPDEGTRAILYHSATTSPSELAQFGFRLFGGSKRYLWSVDLHRNGWKEHNTYQVRTGLSLPLKNHRVGVRLCAEQWFPTEGRVPYRLYPEIALWSNSTSKWNYGFVLSNPIRARWSNEGPKTAIVATAGVQYQLLSDVRLMGTWRIIDTKNRFSIGAEWKAKPFWGMVLGLSADNNWGSIGWWLKKNHWRFHSSIQFNQFLGWGYQIGLLHFFS